MNKFYLCLCYTVIEFSKSLVAEAAKHLAKRQATALLPPSSASSTKCSQYKWQCDNGDCINSEDLCDGTPNCSDSSDETVANCIAITCPRYSFRCLYGACVQGKQATNNQIQLSIINYVFANDIQHCFC